MTFRIFLNHPPSIIIVSSLVLNILLWFLGFFLFPNSSSTTILHYSVGVGIDFIGTSRQILTLPICGLIIITGNLILGTSIRNIDQASAYIIWSIMPIVQIILIAAFALVYFANS